MVGAEARHTGAVTVTRNELGSCLREWRSRVSPASCGLPAHGQRRTTGLRREELAGLAGVSVDYLVRLEQGRATNPSPEVLGGLARGLRLSQEERDHLYRLAGKTAPGPARLAATLTPSVGRLLERLDDVAVGVFDPAWTMLTCNRTWTALMGEPASLAGRDRNVLWRHFSGQESRVVRTEEQTAAWERSMVAHLRVVAGRYPDDRNIRQLVDDLHAVSQRFSAVWRRRDVAAHHGDRKTIDHPEVGRLTVDCDVLTVEGSEVRLVVHTSLPGTVDAEKFGLVRTLGGRDADADGHLDRRGDQTRSPELSGTRN
jgi:transcriptional regulator with XRE-family HTH domain